MSGAQQLQAAVLDAATVSLEPYRQWLGDRDIVAVPHVDWSRKGLVQVVVKLEDRGSEREEEAGHTFVIDAIRYRAEAAVEAVVPGLVWRCLEQHVRSNDT